jgi:hypothetical protein
VRALGNSVGERWALDKLHHERSRGASVLDTIDGRDVGMVQRRQHLRFPREAGEALGVLGEEVRQDREGDVAIELPVARAVTSPSPPAPRLPVMTNGPIRAPAWGLIGPGL